MSYSQLELDNQICFPLYACSKEVIKIYKPYLDEIGLTYTQYLVMMVLWQEKQCTSKLISEKLYLDSGTLTPVLKRLEKDEILSRNRDINDERNLMITLLPKGQSLANKAKHIPECIANQINLTNQEAEILYKLLYKVLNSK